MAHTELIETSYSDIDGTLYGGNLGVEYVLYLMQHGLFNTSVGLEILLWYAQYKTGICEKSKAIETINQLGARGVAGVSVEQSEKAAQAAWVKSRHKIFPFSREAIGIMKNAGHRVLLVTGSPDVMAHQFAKSLRIPKSDVVAGELMVFHGRYTGQTLSCPASAQQKLEAVVALTKNIDPHLFYALGDNERDSSVMSHAKYPLAMNPNRRLRQIAIRNSWEVVNPSNVLPIMRQNTR